ncbi:HlyD family efflux transporter periplasmic adaptor subunit [Breoghania sp.]|uniref:HlyD family secretion protein n=1 Tax=Breoghania sp. TaxID=2065378 RepID=UPI0029C9C04F|nr:HlyD family efflux transporter periplasmic adaptor subunit [Breoghania sp.]
MRKLRSRQRPDNHANERRANKRSLGRWIYLAMLLAIGLGVADYAWGDFVILRAPGLVLQERIDVEAQYVGRLDELPLRIGQSVHSGDVLGVVSSVEISERLAQLSLRVAELTRQAIEKQEQMNIAESLLPIAKVRVEEARAVKENLTHLSGKGLAPADRVLEALTEKNSAEEMLIRLEAQIRSFPATREALQPAIDRVRTTFNKLTALYDDGVLRAPVDGIIDSNLPAKGDVFLTGEKILSLYTGPKYVLAYLPAHNLLPVTVGEEVRLESGQQTLAGRIVEVLPVTDTLPAEFQNTFKPAERSQLARIVIEDGASFPLHTKVRVTRPSQSLETVMSFFSGAWRTALSLFTIDAVASQGTADREIAR